jgi:hypothetical protein
MSKNYGLLTSVDLDHASAFVADQITRLKCEDKNVQARLCDREEGGCMAYKEEDWKREWRPPMTVSSAKPCSTYSYENGRVGSRCYTKPITLVPNEKDNEQDALHPFCLPPLEAGGEQYCGWVKDNTVEELKMTTGTCIITNKETCNKYSTYRNQKISKTGDVFSAKSTTRDVRKTPELNAGTCEPAECDPEKDENCLPRKCLAYHCGADTDCSEEGTAYTGLTGNCIPTTTGGVGYCEVDQSYDCNECENKCGGTYGRCANSGYYDLSKIDGGRHVSCWEKEGKKEEQKCDSDYTTGTCYGNGACPTTKVPEGVSQVYLEWHDDAGECDPSKHLYCKNGSCVKSGKLDGVGRCTCTQNGDCPGESVCNPDGMCYKNKDAQDNIISGGQCVYGNEELREYCEQPQCRPEATGEDDKVIHNNNNRLPPHRWDSDTGTCNITQRFCAYGYQKFGIGKDTEIYNLEKKPDNGCKSDADCSKHGTDWKCGENKDTFDEFQGVKTCTGPTGQCLEDNFGDTVMKSLIGETLYNSFQTGEACLPYIGGMTERFEMANVVPFLREHVDRTPANQEVASIVVSKHKIESQTIIIKDTIPGIDAFRTVYKNGTEGIGFSIDQVKLVFPDNVKTTPAGDEYLVIMPDQKFNTPNLTKMYFLLTLKNI